MNRRQFLTSSAAVLLAAPALLRNARAQESPFRVKYFPVSAGMGSRDVAPAPDGTIWFCGQRNGTLGRLDPQDGTFKLIDLGKGAAPRVSRPDGAPWVTEGGQMRLHGSIPPITRSRCSGCPKRKPMPTSTPACSTKLASSGSPASPASTAGSTRNRLT
jgi:streptogramin lyase